jgi:hypothetical protein
MQLQKKYDRLRSMEGHGQRLNQVFGTPYEPLEIYEKLRRIELKLKRLNTDYCNGVIQEADYDSACAKLEAKVVALLGQNHPIYLNRDPRGYALKIRDSYMKAHNLDLPTDWGGYGLIAPEF